MGEAGAHEQKESGEDEGDSGREVARDPSRQGLYGNKTEVRSHVIGCKGA